MSKYWTDLVVRNIDCNNITEDEFVKAMFSDMLEAEEKYNDLYIPEWINKQIEQFNLYMNRAKNNAENFAKNKWKTEKKRTDYINLIVTTASATYEPSTFFERLSFFDFDVNPGDNGISGNCCLSYNNLTFNALARCFNEIKNNKYFKQATGWKLSYEHDEKSCRTLSRPQIKLIVSKEVEDQMIKDAKALGESICNFYKNCRYFGD